MEITVILEPVEEGGYAVRVPALPGCFSYGKTTAEALRNVREAIALHLKPAKDDVKDLKPGGLVEKITV